uniref:Ig-like domain-containing protein n=1 Tax=Otus sunia TaxID=257818 RepID=A0A8C8B7T7_9STRI
AGPSLSGFQLSGSPSLGVPALGVPALGVPAPHGCRTPPGLLMPQVLGGSRCPPGRRGRWLLQPSQVTLDPPWMPVFVWERVTLTCHGPGAPVPTRWFEGDRLLKLAESDRLQVSRTRRGSSSYRCQRHGAALSAPVTLSFSDDWLVLQVPAQALLEGDTPWLRCQGWGDAKVTRVRFYREQEELGGPTRENELLLPPLQLPHGGRYRCEAAVSSLLAGWQVSAPVAVA